MPYSNWELRWFFEGSIPQGVEEWRDTLEYKGPKPQYDTYIVFPDCDDLGIKESRGEFQVKFRVANLHFTSKSEEIKGKLELWAKRVLDLVNEDTSLFSGLKGESIFVEKDRYQKRYEVDTETNTITAVDHRVDVGIIVEISTIRVKGNDWWTIGIDGLSEAQTDQIVLVQIGAEKVVGEIPNIVVDFENSYSYPKWLSNL